VAYILTIPYHHDSKVIIFEKFPAFVKCVPLELKNEAGDKAVGKV